MNELLARYLYRLNEKGPLKKSDLNYNLSRNFPSSERTAVIRMALLKGLIEEKQVLPLKKRGRSITVYSITKPGKKTIEEYLVLEKEILK